MFFKAQSQTLQRHEVRLKIKGGYDLSKGETGTLETGDLGEEECHRGRDLHIPSQCPRDFEALGEVPCEPGQQGLGSHCTAGGLPGPRIRFLTDSSHGDGGLLQGWGYTRLPISWQAGAHSRMD